MHTTETALLVLTNVPDQAVATAIAESLIQQHLAACVNVLAPCSSVYHWQGAVETSAEIPLLIKTTRDRYDAVEQAIVALHPYELPEVIAVPILAGLPAYLGWLQQHTV